MNYYSFDYPILDRHCVKCRLAELYSGVNFKTNLIIDLMYSADLIRDHLSKQCHYPRLQSSIENLPPCVTPEALLQECNTNFRLSKPVYLAKKAIEIFSQINERYWIDHSNITIYEIKSQITHRSCIFHLDSDCEITERDFDLKLILDMIESGFEIKYQTIDQSNRRIHYAQTNENLMKCAIFSGKLDIIDYLIDECGFDVRAVFYDTDIMPEGMNLKPYKLSYWSYIAFAARFNDASLIHLLKKDCYYIHEAFMRYLIQDCDDMLKTIIADFDISRILNSCSKRAAILDLVIKYDKWYILDLLLHLGFNLDWDIFWKMEIESMDTIHRLIKLGCEPHDLGLTIVSAAFRLRGDLLKFADDVGYINPTTIAHHLYEVIDGDLEMIEFLLSKGVNFSENNKHLKRTIQHITKPRLQVFMLLAKSGVDFTVREIAILAWEKFGYFSVPSTDQFSEYVNVLSYLLSQCPKLALPEYFLRFAISSLPQLLLEILKLHPEIDVNQKLMLNFEDRKKFRSIRSLDCASPGNLSDFPGMVASFRLKSPLDPREISLVSIIENSSYEEAEAILDLLYERGMETHHEILTRYFNHMEKIYSLSNTTNQLNYFKRRGFQYIPSITHEE